MNIQKGISHCDTIGDIFKNPLLVKLINRWHKQLYSNQGIQRKKNKRIRPEYYEFLRSIFLDRSDMHLFLDYIRELIITEDSLYQSIEKSYNIEDRIVTLLAFDEIHTQLSNYNRFTLQGIFQTRIYDIINDAKNRSAHEEDPEEGVYPEISVYDALEGMLERGIPISQDGEIIGYIADTNDHYLVSVQGVGSLREADRVGNYVDEDDILQISGLAIPATRGDMVKRIRMIENILQHIGSGDDEESVLGDDEEALYNALESDFDSQRDTHLDETMIQQHFYEYVDQYKTELGERLKKMPWDTQKEFQGLKLVGTSGDPHESGKNANTPTRKKNLHIVK